jgi:Secretion system C-terminal sorting domain
MPPTIVLHLDFLLTNKILNQQLYKYIKMRKYINVIIAIFLSSALMGQYDVQLTASFSPTTIPVGSLSTLNIAFNNIGNVAIPSNTLGVQVQFPTTKYIPTGAPTGAGADLFNWIDLGSGIWYGINNTSVPGIFGGGPIDFEVEGVQTTSPSAFTQANIGFPGGGTDINNSNNTPSAGLIVTTALPVSISKFSGRSDDCSKATLSWTTESEVNNNGFVIERSLDGRSFEKIGFVESMHNSTKSNDYTFEDIDYTINGIYYYRLVAVDYDGSSMISDIEKIKRICDTNVDLSIYPNPTAEKLNIKFHGFDLSEQLVSIMDGSGKLIRKAMLNTSKVNELLVKDLSPGVYNLKVEKEGQEILKRFIKID